MSTKKPLGGPRFCAELNRTLRDISLLPEGGPFPLVHVITYYLHPDRVGEFNYALRKAHEALVKTNWPGYRVWAKLNGSP